MNPPTINHPQCRVDPVYVRRRNAQIPEAEILAYRVNKNPEHPWWMRAFTFHMDRLTRIAMGQAL